MDRSTSSGFLATTIFGGVLFLLPCLLVLYLLKLGIDLVEGPAGQLAAVLPIFNRLGPAGDLLIAIMLLVLIAFVAGLVAKSRLGASAGRRLRNSPLAALPPVSFLRGILAGFSQDEETPSVVLVPSDQGQTFGFVFGATDGERVCVYVPSAPNWTSGSISFARREDVQETSLSFAEATRIIMMLGSHQALGAVGSKSSHFMHDAQDGPVVARSAVPNAPNASQSKDPQHA